MDDASIEDCIFCSIVGGSSKGDIVFDGGDTLWFRDVSPKAPVHVLGIPKQHIVSLAGVKGDDHALLGKLLHEAASVAAEMGLAADGYRVLTNVGANAGQEVQHLHMHLLGGEPLGPMRC